MTAGAALSGAEARRAARNAGALAAARILSSGALFLFSISLARLLGEEGFGIYGTIGPMINIAATLASFALGLIVIREVARRPQEAGRYLSATLVLQTSFALLAYIGLNAAGLALGYSETLRALAAVAGISLFIDLVGSACYDQLIAHERMVGASVVEIGHVLARIALCLLLLAAGLGLPGVYLATIAAGIGRSAALWALLRRAGVRPRFPVDRSLAGPLLAAALPLAVSALVNSAYAQIDRLISTSVLTTADTAHLNAASVIVSGVIEVLNTTVLVALFPLMARSFQPGISRERNAPFYFMVEKLALFALLIGLPIGLIATQFAAALTVPLFGEPFRASADVLRVLIWYAVLTMVSNVFAKAMMAENRQARYVLVRAGGLALKLVLSVVLLPALGVVGAAAASALAEAAVLAALAALVPLPGWRWGAMARLALVCALASGAMLLGGLLSPVLGIAAGLAVYALGVLRGGVLQAEDADLFYRLAAALLGGALLRRWWKRDVPLSWE